MATMLNVYDRATLKKTAVLQNAYNITEVQEINQIYTLSFTLPAEDEKNKYCLPRHFIRYGDNGQMYRIKSPKVSDSAVGTITYECEHAITTLCDDIMFGSLTYGGRGVYTATTINWLLSHQQTNAQFQTRSWRLKDCDFERQFEYNWEQENLLNALYSIPKEFAANYMWVFDTSNYPWKISLKRIYKNVTPEYYLRAKSNILSSGRSADYSNICTRIYPLGYGEGVNQLTIKDATVNENGEIDEENGTAYGKKYIESPQAYIDKYGIVEKVMVDRRFENANSLYGYAKSMLEVYQEPTMSRTFNVVDLYPITNKPLDDAEVGKLCKLTEDGTMAIVTKTQRRWDVAGDLQVELSTKSSDIATNVADLADRIRIESVYAQGATQIYQHSKDANATPTKGMVISLYFPSEMKQINKVLLRLKLNKFRAYSDTTSTVDAQVPTTTTVDSEVRSTTEESRKYKTTTESQKRVQASSSGGGSGTTGASVASASITGAISTDASWTGSNTLATTSDNSVPLTVKVGAADITMFGGTGYEIYDNDRGHYHTVSLYHSHGHDVNVKTSMHKHFLELYKLAHNHQLNIPEDAHFGSHSHSIHFNSHTHTVEIPAHSHSVEIPAHRHNVTIPSHNHKVTIPAHNHKIAPGIFESGNPTKFDIYIRNELKETVYSRSYNGNIVNWLLDDKNLVPRDTWIDMTIVPNDNAYVISSVFVQGFVQSRGGGNY